MENFTGEHGVVQTFKFWSYFPPAYVDAQPLRFFSLLGILIFTPFRLRQSPLLFYDIIKGGGTL